MAHLYWRKESNGALVAVDRTYGATFHITVVSDPLVGKPVRLRVEMPGAINEDGYMVPDYNETFDFATVGAAKSFVTRNFS